MKRKVGPLFKAYLLHLLSFYGFLFSAVVKYSVRVQWYPYCYTQDLEIYKSLLESI